MREVPLKDSIAEQLAERKQGTDTYSDVVGRLLEATADEGAEQLADTPTDELAKSAMTVTDVKSATEEQLAANEFVKQTYDVDPDKYNDEETLRAAVQAAREDRDGSV